MTKKCCHCMERDAEPSFVRCEPCMVRDMTAEVRWMYEQFRQLRAKVASIADFESALCDRVEELEAAKRKKTKADNQMELTEAKGE